MSSKAKAPRGRPARRAVRARSGPPRYLLLGGVVVVALLVVAAIVLLNRGPASSPGGPGASTGEAGYGAANARVVVVEYADFQCPYCREFAAGAERRLRQDYADKGLVRLVFRHFAFIGSESTWAAEAAECAGEQGQFWPYHDMLYERQGGENTGAFSRDHLKGFAAELGLNPSQFNRCLDTDKYASRVQAQFDEGRSRGVSSTPTVLVNDRPLSSYDYATLQAAVDAALKSP